MSAIQDRELLPLPQRGLVVSSKGRYSEIDIRVVSRVTVRVGVRVTFRVRARLGVRVRTR